MQKVAPTPRTLTLRFKQNTTTILLEVDPLYSFASVRAELLRALQETNPSGQINGHQIPQNPDDIILGQAIDRHNLKLGYTTIGKDVGEADAITSGKGKGKSTASQAGIAQMQDCPQGAGLRTADVVAFKFRTEADSSDQKDVAVGEEPISEQWNVVVPSMEETYGEEEAPDEGIEMDDEEGRV